MTAAPQYPLWCVDSGDGKSEGRYRGPFKTLHEALVVISDVGGKARRCRRVTALEVGLADRLERLVEDFDEGLPGYGAFPDLSWGRWDDQLVSWRDSMVKGQDVVEMAARVLAPFLQVELFVCEGDEGDGELAAVRNRILDPKRTDGLADAVDGKEKEGRNHG